MSRTVISYERALELVLETASPAEPEQVPVEAALGRVLAAEVVSRVDSPPFDKAAMDGFAVRAADVESLPAELRLVGEVYAGQFPEFSVGGGEAARITTGAPVPEGADMVVMVEHTEEPEEGRVLVKKLSGGNICPRGEDISEGEVVLEVGMELNPLRAGVAAGAGGAEVTVRRRPRVALLCTGTEVKEPGQTLQKGQIYNSNGSILSALLGPRAEELLYLGIVGDDRGEVERALGRGLEADLLIISGGVSAGSYDLVPPSLEELGAERIFHKCAMKPGKPTWFGRRGDTLAFGMPGNPLSCYVVLQTLVMPCLRRIAGHSGPGPRLLTGVSAESFANKPGRRHFVPCRGEVQGGRCVLERTPVHGSADIAGAASSKALMSLPPDCGGVERGEEVCFLWTEGPT